MITQSDALQKYPIGKSYLENVRHLSYKASYTTYLYLIKDIEHLCITKYGTEDEYKKVQTERIHKKHNKEVRKNNTINIREKELNNYLKSIGLPGIRNDSEICMNYIENGDKGGFTKEQIGEIMHEMKFYYEYTDYKNILQKSRHEAMSDMRKYDGYCNWSSEDEDDVRDNAKFNAMFKYVRDNYDNVHKCIIEVPRSLIGTYNECYEMLKKSRSQIKAPKIVLPKISNIISEYKKTKALYKKNNTEYKLIIREIKSTID